MSMGLLEAARSVGIDIETARGWERDGLLEECCRYNNNGKRSGYRDKAIKTRLLALQEQKTAPEQEQTEPEQTINIPLPLPTEESWRKLPDYERSVYANDIHCPYQDETALGVFLAFLHWFQPKDIFLGGDIVDFYQLSKFDKDPDRRLRLQEDLHSGVDVLRRIRRVAPGAEIIYIEGNHEQRLTRYIWQHAEIAGLEAMRLESLLHFEDYRIRFVRALEACMHHGFLVEHGEIVRKSSGYTAKGQLEKRGISGISGHTHRLATHYHTNMSGDYLWVENGCLCDRNPVYVRNPDWQQGFSCGHWNPTSNRFCLEQVLVSQGMAVFAGREFEPLRGI